MLAARTPPNEIEQEIAAGGDPAQVVAAPGRCLAAALAERWRRNAEMV